MATKRAKQTKKSAALYLQAALHIYAEKQTIGHLGDVDRMRALARLLGAAESTVWKWNRQGLPRNVRGVRLAFRIQRETSISAEKLLLGD